MYHPGLSTSPTRLVPLVQLMNIQRLRARGEWGDRGRDGWMASPTQWT